MKAVASQSVDHAFERYVAEYQQDPDFLAEQMALDVVEHAVKLMKASNMTQADLARKIGVSRARISRILNAHPNLTLRSIAMLGFAVGGKPYAGLSTQPPQQALDGSHRSQLTAIRGEGAKPHRPLPVTVPTPSR